MAENRNFVYHDFDIDVGYTSPVGGALVGNFILIGAMWAVAFATTIEGELGAAYTEAKSVAVPKKTGVGEAMVTCDPAYLNTTTKVVSKTDGGTDLLVGYCRFDAADADVTVRIRLNSSLAL